MLNKTFLLQVNQKSIVRSRSSVSNLGANSVAVEVNTGSTLPASGTGTVITSQPKPKLVKQKQSLCEEEMEEEGGDQPTDMRDLVKRLPEFKVSSNPLPPHSHPENRSFNPLF